MEVKELYLKMLECVDAGMKCEFTLFKPMEKPENNIFFADRIDVEEIELEGNQLAFHTKTSGMMILPTLKLFDLHFSELEDGNKTASIGFRSGAASDSDWMIEFLFHC